MSGGDPAGGAGQTAHHQAVGLGAIRKVIHTAQQIPMGDARGSKEDIFRGNQIIQRSGLY